MLTSKILENFTGTVLIERTAISNSKFYIFTYIMIKKKNQSEKLKNDEIKCNNKKVFIFSFSFLNKRMLGFLPYIHFMAILRQFFENFYKFPVV